MESQGKPNTFFSATDQTSPVELTTRFMGSDIDKHHDLGEKKPYFGMTGTQLNIWVTVACTTAMTLFGAPSTTPMC